MNRILLTGAAGQLGFELRRTLAPLGDLHSATRSGLLVAGMACETADLAEPDALLTTLERLQPTLIVNAAAYTAVDRAEIEAEQAMQVNARALGVMGTWAAAHAATVLHYSTDYVFDGNAKAAYSVDAGVAPLGSYGRSKLAGEQALAASGADHLIVRTAWVYAARGHNFLRSMLRLAKDRDELRIVADQFGAPTPASLIAATTAAVLARRMHMDADARAKCSGIYHLTASGHCSWFEFACAIMQRAQAAGLMATMPRVTAISSAEYPTPAKRPAWSVLDCARLCADFNVHLPSWQQGLDSVMADLRAAQEYSTC